MTLKIQQRMSTKKIPGCLRVQEAYTSRVSTVTWLVALGKPELAWNDHDGTAKFIKSSNLYRRLKRRILA